MAVRVVTPLPPILYILPLALGLVAAVLDFRSRRIPNWLTVSGVFLGLVVNSCFPGKTGVVFAAQGLLLALILYFPLYLLRAMGAGDVKLMAAMGALVGPGNWIVLFLATSIAGGIAALFVALSRGRFQQTWFNTAILVDDLFHFRAPYRNNNELDVRNPASLRLPHGISIAIGAIVLVLFACIHPL